MPTVHQSTRTTRASCDSETKEDYGERGIGSRFTTAIAGSEEEDFRPARRFFGAGITDYEAGKKVSEALAPNEGVDAIYERLSRVVKASAIPAWLEKPNQAFDGFTPIELVERGEIDRLWDMIYHLMAQRLKS